jgi:hypothetical protein
MSYPISGLNKSYTQQDYEHVGKPLIVIKTKQYIKICTDLI